MYYIWRCILQVVIGSFDKSNVLRIQCVQYTERLFAQKISSPDGYVYNVYNVEHIISANMLKSILKQ